MQRVGSRAVVMGASVAGLLAARVLAVLGRFIEASGPDLVVVACNTASTLALTQLREVYGLPFVGILLPEFVAAYYAILRAGASPAAPGHRR